MLALAFLLAQAAAATPSAAPTAVPTPRPAPALGRSYQAARQKSLSDHAAEMKAKGTPVPRVSFDDLQSVDPPDPEPPAKADGGTRAKSGSGAPETGTASADKASAEAQRRMDRAVERGLDVPERASSARRDRARREWDDATEACRRTPGCVPRYRDDAGYGESKPLKTDAELIEEARKRGFAEPHPLPT